MAEGRFGEDEGGGRGSDVCNEVSGCLTSWDRRRCPQSSLEALCVLVSAVEWEDTCQCRRFGRSPHPGAFSSAQRDSDRTVHWQFPL